MRKFDPQSIISEVIQQGTKKPFKGASSNGSLNISLADNMYLSRCTKNNTY